MLTYGLYTYHLVKRIHIRGSAPWPHPAGDPIRPRSSPRSLEIEAPDVSTEPQTRVCGSINTSRVCADPLKRPMTWPDRIPARVVGSLIYSLLRILLDALAIRDGGRAVLQA